jgi:protein KRI1
MKGISDPESDEDKNDPNRETNVAQQKRLKQEFINAAVSDDGSDSDILMKKPKTKKEIARENKDFEKLAEKEQEDRLNADKVLSNFWSTSADAKLNKDEKFLKNYILGEKWKEMGEDYDDLVDEEDFDRDSEIDEFEKNYNFRFEEPGGKAIKTYPRKIEDTYRIARNKRQSKKVEKKKRMKEYKEEKKREFEEIRALKRKDILDKIEKTELLLGDHKV